MANERKKPAKKNTRSRSTPRRTSTRKKATRKKPAGAARRKRRRKTNGQSLFANRWVQAALALVIVGALAATVLALGNRHQRVTYDFGTRRPLCGGGRHLRTQRHRGLDYPGKKRQICLYPCRLSGLQRRYAPCRQNGKRELKSCPQGRGAGGCIFLLSSHHGGRSPRGSPLYAGSRALCQSGAAADHRL